MQRQSQNLLQIVPEKPQPQSKLTTPAQSDETSIHPTGISKEKNILPEK